MKKINLSRSQDGTKAEVALLYFALDEALASPDTPLSMLPGERKKLAVYLAQYIVMRRRKSGKRKLTGHGTNG